MRTVLNTPTALPLCSFILHLWPCCVSSAQFWLLNQSEWSFAFDSFIQAIVSTLVCPLFSCLFLFNVCMCPPVTSGHIELALSNVSYVCVCTVQSARSLTMSLILAATVFGHPQSPSLALPTVHSCFLPPYSQ